MRVKGHGMWMVTACLAAVCGACGGGGSPVAPTPAPVVTTPAPSPAGPATRGAVTDATGDIRPDDRVARSPDIASAIVDVGAETVRVSVRFVPGTFSADTTSIEVHLDTDENTATGLAGTSPAGDDRDRIGADFLLLRTGIVPRLARDVLFECTSRVFEQCATVAQPTVTVVADGLDFTFARSALHDDGRMAFKVLANVFIDFTQSDADVDVAPDTGLAAAPVR